ncbi:hypothetical protein PMX63_09790, partial [Collinsella aerofaciens]|uniref:hypothetical protein n=1 Tax=Collinsella aerofaciens TaxID=74426 RepID=UPI001E5607E6
CGIPSPRKEAAPRGRRPKWLSHIVFHAKYLRAQTATHSNKKLHNLFLMSVHSLLAKRDYQYSSPFCLGIRSALNHRQQPNNLRQREHHSKTTPLSTSNERYVVQRSPNQFH